MSRRERRRRRRQLRRVVRAHSRPVFLATRAVLAREWVCMSVSPGRVIQRK